MLKKHDVCATFFVEGHRIAGHEDVLRRMHEAGHHIGNHSFTHPDFSTLSRSECLEEVRRTDEALFSALNFHTWLLRPPSGILPEDRRALLEAAGYKNLSLVNQREGLAGAGRARRRDSDAGAGAGRDDYGGFPRPSGDDGGGRRT